MTGRPTTSGPNGTAVHDRGAAQGHGSVHGHRSVRDRGSATLWAIAFSLVIWVVAASVVLCGTAVIARHRAAGAADLAAVAAASAAISAGSPASDTGAACGAARVVAEANGAHVVACAVDGFSVTVTVAVPLRGLAQLLAMRAGSVIASARAGPA